MAAHSFTTEKSNASSYQDGYDEEDRFRRFVQSGQNNDVYLDRSAIGNILDVNVNNNAAPRSYSAVHELTSVDNVAQTFDDDGNQLTTHSGVSLSWSDANRVQSTTNGNVTGTYQYDADNKRIHKQVTDNGTTTVDTLYIHAGPNCIAEYNIGTAPAAPAQEYIYGQEIDSLVLLSQNNNVDSFTVMRNQQWSVTALASTSDGSIAERYTYDQFGKRTILEGNGSTVRQSSSYDMSYGYTSRRHDDEAGLMYFRARYYDLTTGEFTSRDRLEYVDGKSLTRGYFPITGIDPFGLKLRQWHLGDVAPIFAHALEELKNSGQPFEELSPLVLATLVTDEVGGGFKEIGSVWAVDDVVKRDCCDGQSNPHVQPDEDFDIVEDATFCWAFSNSDEPSLMIAGRSDWQLGFIRMDLIVSHFEPEKFLSHEKTCRWSKDGDGPADPGDMEATCRNDNKSSLIEYAVKFTFDLGGGVIPGQKTPLAELNLPKGEFIIRDVREMTIDAGFGSSISKAHGRQGSQQLESPSEGRKPEERKDF